ncbi:hypothetical protein C8J56DRAFT_1171943 [Mycena floridula]|nr:hypothetical protein C8J56DRAFT_1171943 [Mycena floridula]
MADNQPNFGNTLTSGIQEVSALLPLLGTEQCERHAGSALECGYMYAAATPLSIFGSLGIVKASFTTFSATITHPLNGARRIKKEYVAEAKLLQLLEDQHIDDIRTVSVNWSGWRWRTTNTQTTNVMLSFLHHIPWNIALIVTTFICAIMSVTPYIYLIHPAPRQFTSWGFPFLRGLGSALAIISMQLSLQCRINRIIQCRLLFMKLDRYLRSEQDKGLRNNLHWDDADWLVEKRLTKLSMEKHWLSSKLQKEEKDELKVLTTVEWMLPIYQLLMAVGMGMIIVGYIGCFNLVNISTAFRGPYVWVGLEVFLSLIRIALWGWNPDWDDTAIQMSLTLVNTLPLVTTSQDFKSLDPTKDFDPLPGVGEPFIVQDESQFFGSVTGHTQEKFLMVTIHNLHQGALSSMVLTIPSHINTVVECRRFSSTWQAVPGILDAIQVQLGEELRYVYHPNTSDLLDAVYQHSGQLAQRLRGYFRISRLDLQWKLEGKNTKNIKYLAFAPDLQILSTDDTRYMRVHRLQKNMLEFMRHRDAALDQYYITVWESQNSNTITGRDMLEEMAFMEILCIAESCLLELALIDDFRKTTESLARERQSDNLTWGVFPEYFRALRGRIQTQRIQFMERWKDMKPQDYESVSWWDTLSAMVNSNWTKIELMLLKYMDINIVDSNFDTVIHISV